MCFDVKSTGVKRENTGRSTCGSVELSFFVFWPVTVKQQELLTWRLQLASTHAANSVTKELTLLAVIDQTHFERTH